MLGVGEWGRLLKTHRTRIGVGGPEGGPTEEEGGGRSRTVGATLVVNWYKVTGSTVESKHTQHSLS